MDMGHAINLVQYLGKPLERDLLLNYFQFATGILGKFISGYGSSRYIRSQKFATDRIGQVITGFRCQEDTSLDRAISIFHNSESTLKAVGLNASRQVFLSFLSFFFPLIVRGPKRAVFPNFVNI